MTQAALHEAIRSKLTRIYGSESGQRTFTRLLDMLPPGPPVETSGLAISEKDAILITYGDQVQDGQRPPLQVLHEFLQSGIAPTISGVHILPFFPASSDDGFSVIDYYAVDDSLGTWADIDAMRSDFRLMFDAVFNHISAESEWFRRYRQDEAPYNGYFIAVPPDADLSQVVRPRALPLLTPFDTASGIKHLWTTFSADQVDLNLANPDVLLELIRVLLFYVQHGAEFIRLDAIAFLWKAIGTPSIHLEQTHLIIQLMRDVLDLVAPQVLLITETNVPHAENISYFGNGHNEAQMVYQFALPPLVFHTLSSGDASALTRWAQSLQPPGPRCTFFNFTASHDGIGLRPVSDLLNQTEIDALVNRVQAHGGHVSFKTNANGSQSPYELNISYFDAITDPAVTARDPQQAVDRFMVSQAIQLALAGVPGIYFHNLFGSRNWAEGVAETGRFRSINRQKLALDTLTQELADSGSIRHAVFSRYMALLKLRRTQPALHPLAGQIIHDLSPSVFAVERIAQDSSERILALHNVCAEPIRLDLSGHWRNLTDRSRL